MLLAMDAAISIQQVLPELIMTVAGCIVLLLGQSPTWNRRLPWVTLAAIVACILLVRFGSPLETRAGGLLFDPLANFVRLGALIVGVALILVAWSEARGAERGEFFSMMIFSLTGLMLVGPADNLLILFLALELVSIPTYIMVTLSRDNAVALEAGTKYFYLGALSAAVMAYGFSFVYGVSGTASISGSVEAVRVALAETGTMNAALASIGVVLSIGGLLFKVAGVPFHFYIADVYQGASSPVAGFLGFVPKMAGIVAIMKIVSLTGWNSTAGGLFWMLWIIAALSMTVGNVLALRQTNVKRLLAYSGIAHAGYMLVAVVASPAASPGMLGDGAAAILFYVVIYGIANLGAFAVLALLRVRGESCETVREIAGLLRRHPGLALLMALAMFTLMGMPPTPGFWGKLSLFGSALATSQVAAAETRPWVVALVIIAVLNSALAAAYYLRVIAALLLYENDEPAEAAPREAQQMGAVLCGFLILIFAFVPGALLNASRAASRQFRDVPIIVSEPLPAAPAPQPQLAAGPPEGQ